MNISHSISIICIVNYSCSISVVFTFGDAAAFIAKEAKKAGLTTFRCNSHLEMANAYSDIREKGDVILVKGSRGLRMERVVEELKDRE